MPADTPIRAEIRGGTVQLDLQDADLLDNRWYVAPSGHVIRFVEVPCSGDRRRDRRVRQALFLMRLVAERALGQPLPRGFSARPLNGDLTDCRRSNVGVAHGRRGPARPTNFWEHRFVPGCYSEWTL